MEVTESYTMPTSIGEGVFKEKGSKFLAFAHPVTKMEEIDALLEEYRKKYWDSRHVCFAYRLSDDGSVTKAFDGGEPYYSAGMPMLNEIKAREFTYVIVIVIRYFGGTKLGVPGLVAAYGAAAASALDQCKTKVVQVTIPLKIHYPYTTTSEVTRIINQNNLTVSASEFMEDCRQTIEIPIADYEKIFDFFDKLGIIESNEK